jgi:cardiolipin synthase (CMP-forming)
MSLRWIPNAICVGRVLLVFPLVFALLDDRYRFALTLVVIAGVSDGLDGFLAKRFGWRTRLGSLLDPAADKFLVMSVFIVLTYLSRVPAALTAIVIARDLVIVAGAVAYQLLVGDVRGEPTLISKLNTGCQLAFLVFVIMNAGFDWPPALVIILVGASVVFTSITSGLNYVLVWSKRAWRNAHAAA